MRWSGQELGVEADDALPGLARLNNLVRSVQTPEFAGLTFHEVLAKSALNHVPGASKALPFGWTINPYRGCSHQCVFCFARNTHTYLDLDAGRDFDTQIIVKVNLVEVLERELARPSWQRPNVALGTNTDPYQRAEGRYRLMPGVISALAASETPLSILTKGTLLRRDIPLLQAAAERVPVETAMSIAIYDDELQRSIEPGAPSTAARLATVRAVRDAGLPCSVFLMPVLPYLTDSREHLERALERIADAGATSVAYSALHLRPGAKEWFAAWLAREHPELVPRYRALYGAGAYAPKEYRRQLAGRIRPLLRRHGLDRPHVDPATGSMGARPRPANAGVGALAAELSPAAAAALQPTLF
jgi:DNA repair photolyase